MHIWAAVEVERELSEQKRVVHEIEGKIGFMESDASLLPLHVSLKIADEIPAEHEEGIRKDIHGLLLLAKPFEIEVDGIELHESIVWIKMKPNRNLIDLHQGLCELLESKYGVAPHPLDNAFIYHATLFLDSDKKKISKAYEMVKDMELPRKLSAKRFVIGSSPTGAIGTYAVDQTIEK